MSGSARTVEVGDDADVGIDGVDGLGAAGDHGVQGRSGQAATSGPWKVLPAIAVADDGGVEGLGHSITAHPREGGDPVLS
jgi:hypothetical protein